MNQIFGNEVDRLNNNIHPEDLDEIKLLLPSLGSKRMASSYDKAQKHVFPTLAFGNKTYLIGPQFM